MTTWGVVSMVRGPAQDILRFAAHHLDLGADRLYLYLDEPNPEAQHQLEQHPKVQVCHWGIFHDFTMNSWRELTPCISCDNDGKITVSMTIRI